jgi:hypothetical protein
VLGELIWSKLNEARRNYGIDLTTYYRLLIKLIGLKQTDVARVPLGALKKLKKKIEKADAKKFGENLNKFEVAIDVIYQFFNKHLKLRSFEELPSHIALVPMIYYVYTKISRNSKITDTELWRLLSWYILTTLRAIFARGVDSKLEKALIAAERGIDAMFDFEKIARQKAKKIRKDELIKAFRGRGRGIVSDAAKFLLKVLLTLNKADDWSGKLIDFSRNKLEPHHIFPRSIDERADSIANLTFIDETINKSIRNKHPREYIFNELKLSPDTLRKHFMPIEKECYDDFERFINERASIIINEGKKLLPDLFG